MGASGARQNFWLYSGHPRVGNTTGWPQDTHKTSSRTLHVREIYTWNYSQPPLYGYPLNTDNLLGP